MTLFFAGAVVDVIREGAALTDHGVQVTARVRLLVDGQPLVTFPMEGRTTEALLPRSAPVRAGDTLRVVYLPEDPSVARAEGATTTPDLPWVLCGTVGGLAMLAAWPVGARWFPALPPPNRRDRRLPREVRKRLRALGRRRHAAPRVRGVRPRVDRALARLHAAVGKAAKPFVMAAAVAAMLTAGAFALITFLVFDRETNSPRDVRQATAPILSYEDRGGRSADWWATVPATGVVTRLDIDDDLAPYGHPGEVPESLSVEWDPRAPERLWPAGDRPDSISDRLPVAVPWVAALIAFASTVVLLLGLVGRFRGGRASTAARG